MSYNPSLHTTSNKPYGVSGLPIDARSFYYDEVTYSYRLYNSTNEVLTYLDTPTKRKGKFSVFINFSGQTREYWFRDGEANINLVEKTGGSSGTTPTTFLQIPIGSTNTEVILDWSLVSSIHGQRPVYIDLYEIIDGNTSIQTTSRCYTEDNGLTYKWYIGPTAISKAFEIRIMGYVQPIELQDPYVSPGYIAPGYFVEPTTGILI